MKTTIKEVREVVRNVLTEATEGTRTKFGYLNAAIGYDYRYTDMVAVYLEPDGKVSVEVTTGSPVGGMDYDSGGQTHNDVDHKASKANASAADVLGMLRTVLVNDKYNFKRYGKPTKNFTWSGVGKGLSIALCDQALNGARAKAGLGPAPKGRGTSKGVGKVKRAPIPSKKTDAEVTNLWDSSTPEERKAMLRPVDWSPEEIARLVNTPMAQIDTDRDELVYYLKHWT